MTQILSTIAFKASLLEKLKEQCLYAKDIIGRWSKLSVETSKISLDADLKELMLSARLTGLVTAIETLLNDALVNIFIAYPPKFGKKSISAQDFISSGTYLQTIKNMASSSVNDLSYKTFKEYLDEWQKLAVKLPIISEEQINTFTEIKATRDLYIHNNGKINDLYMRKAGEKARRPENKGKMPIDDSYISSASSLSEFIVSAVEDALLNKFNNCTKGPLIYKITIKRANFINMKA